MLVKAATDSFCLKVIAHNYLHLNIQSNNFYSFSSHRQLETQIRSAVDTDAIVLKHQAISTYSAD